jgi:hypothetical protein
MAPSPIILRRTTAHSWHALALFVKVELDGQLVGRIGVGESRRYAVEPGLHTMSEPWDLGVVRSTERGCSGWS